MKKMIKKYIKQKKDNNHLEFPEQKPPQKNCPCNKNKTIHFYKQNPLQQISFQ
jgi:hypothetical protein